MELYEKVVGSDIKFSGDVLTVRVDDVELPGGVTSKREVIQHNGAVGIVPVTEKREVLLVRQYRSASKKIMLELPAGKLEKGEDPFDCGLRELEEETGFSAGKMEKLISYFSSPAILEEILHLYIAFDLKPGKVNLDEDEFLECVKLPLTDIKQMILNGEIQDAKTIIGIMLADEFLKNM
ncbi:MAG: NUDIX hydrolase [Clostridia bacterium]|nr:NUDIX hydrolase [Clostridia bacterium]